MRIFFLPFFKFLLLTFFGYSTVFSEVKGSLSEREIKTSFLSSIVLPPTVNLGPDLVVCNGNPVILDVFDPSIVTYSWSSSPLNTDSKDTIYTSGTYWVTVTDNFNNSASDTINITFSQLNVNLGFDVYFCPGDTIAINGGNPGNTYLWNTGDITQIIQVFVPGNYSVTISDTLGCSISDTLFAGYHDTAVVDLGPDITECTGGFLILDAGNTVTGQTFLWSNGMMTQLTQVAAPGIYWVEVTTPAGCITSDTLIYTVNPLPFGVFGSDTTVCGIYLLDAGNPGSEYVWNTGDTTQILAIHQSGTYSVTITNSFGCIALDTIIIFATPGLSVDLGLDQVSCTPVSLDAGFVGSAYVWNTGDISQTILVTQSGLYSVFVTDAMGCSGADTVEVIVSNLNLYLGPDTSMCGGMSLYAGNPGCQYAWSNGQTTQQTTVYQSGNYFVTVTDSLGCTVTDAINVTITTLSAGFVTDDTLYVNQISNFINMSSPSGTGWIWDFGDGSPAALAENPTHVYSAPGIRTVTLIVYDGFCVDTFSFVVNVIYAVSVEENMQEFNYLHIYPNPGNGKFTISFEIKRSSEINFMVYDPAGRELYKYHFSEMVNSVYNIDLSTFSSGVYYLCIETENGIVRKKLIIN